MASVAVIGFMQVAGYMVEGSGGNL